MKTRKEIKKEGEKKMIIKASDIQAETVCDAIREIEDKYQIYGDRAEAIAEHIVTTDTDYEEILIRAEDIQALTVAEAIQEIEEKYQIYGDMAELIAEHIIFTETDFHQ